MTLLNQPKKLKAPSRRPLLLQLLKIAIFAFFPVQSYSQVTVDAVGGVRPGTLTPQFSLSTITLKFSGTGTAPIDPIAYKATTFFLVANDPNLSKIRVLPGITGVRQRIVLVGSEMYKKLRIENADAEFYLGVNDRWEAEWTGAKWVEVSRTDLE